MSASFTRARGELISKCTLATLASIAAALDCRVKDLFTEEGEGRGPGESPQAAAAPQPGGGALPPGWEVLQR